MPSTRSAITRISFGAQSFHAGELSQLGRRHSPADIVDAVAAAREASIGSINLDLLYDVPGQTLATWTDSLERALALAPDHLSLYSLILDDPDAEGLTGPGGDHLPTTAGARRWRERARKGQDDDRAAGMYHFADASPGREPLPRLRAVELGPAGPREPAQPGLLGAPLGRSCRAGSACVRRRRPALERRPSRRLCRGAPAGRARSRSRPCRQAAWSRRSTPAAAAAEAIILGLRLDAGVPIVAFLEPPFDETLAWADAAGLVEQTPDGRIRLTTNGRLLSNEVFARLI